MPRTAPEPVELTESDLESLRAQLEVKRREMLELYKHDIRVGQESSDDNADDSLDRANNSFNRELMFSLSDVERGMLIQIEDAVARMEKGEFGICTHCEISVPLARLKAVPWAQYCIDCQEKEELGELDG